MIRRGERGIWQRQRWEHTIRDDRDLGAHLDYIHFKPVKHGLVEHPAEWPHPSFRRCVAGGLYPAGWMRRAGEPPETGEGDESKPPKQAQAARIIPDHHYLGQPDTQTTVSGGRRCAFPPYACWAK